MKPLLPTWSGCLNDCVCLKRLNLQIYLSKERVSDSVLCKLQHCNWGVTVGALDINTINIMCTMHRRLLLCCAGISSARDSVLATAAQCSPMNHIALSYTVVVVLVDKGVVGQWLQCWMADGGDDRGSSSGKLSKQASNDKLPYRTSFTKTFIPRAMHTYGTCLNVLAVQLHVHRQQTQVQVGRVRPTMYLYQVGI